MNKKITEGVKQYYSEKILTHGATSKGVDWNSTESQHLRFKQLCKILPEDVAFSLCDFGCGYGELFKYLHMNLKSHFQYLGFDIAPAMIAEAKKQNQENKNVSFTTLTPSHQQDFTIASGIFNIRLHLADDNEWQEYIIQTLHQLNDISTKGFSFNALTSYSDKEFMQDYLYYANPTFLFDYCKLNFSKNVALLHDYNLYEFTILVRK